MVTSTPTTSSNRSLAVASPGHFHMAAQRCPRMGCNGTLLLDGWSGELVCHLCGRAPIASA